MYDKMSHDHASHSEGDEGEDSSCPAGPAK